MRQALHLSPRSIPRAYGQAELPDFRLVGPPESRLALRHVHNRRRSVLEDPKVVLLDYCNRRARQMDPRPGHRRWTLFHFHQPKPSS